MPSKILLYGVDVPKLKAEIPPPNPVFTAPAKADSVLYFFLFVEVLKTVLYSYWILYNVFPGVSIGE